VPGTAPPVSATAGSVRVHRYCGDAALRAPQPLVQRHRPDSTLAATAIADRAVPGTPLCVTPPAPRIPRTLCSHLCTSLWTTVDSPYGACGRGTTRPWTPDDKNVAVHPRPVSSPHRSPATSTPPGPGWPAPRHRRPHSAQRRWRRWTCHLHPGPQRLHGDGEPPPTAGAARPPTSTGPGTHSR